MLYIPTKRFKLIFQIWWYDYPNEHKLDFKHTNVHIKSGIEDYDTIEELREAANLYEDVYKDTPRPTDEFGYWYNKITKQRCQPKWNDKNIIHVDDYKNFHNGENCYWGYVLLDYVEEKIIGVYHDKFNPFTDWKNNLGLLDSLFRKDNEIPKNYKWDTGEFTGWLQYRWGNHLNAIEIEDELNIKKAQREAEQKARKRAEKEELENLMKEYGYEDENRCEEIDV